MTHYKMDMQEKKIIYKVPNGKLLKVFLIENSGVIDDIKITGDFFVYPEEAIDELENALKNAPLIAADLTKLINNFIREKNVTLYGVDVESLVKVLCGL